MRKIIGPDVSFYQDEPGTPQGIDFARMRQVADFVIIRSGQNLWPDPVFKTSWSKAKEARLPRGSYWFYDSRADPKRQAELWVEQLGSDLGELPLFADIEEAYGGQYKGWQNWYDFLERLKALVGGKEIGIYTAFFYWRDNAPDPLNQADRLEYFHQFPLWIANYGVAQPSVPKPWGGDEWLFWQYTATGDGGTYGVESNAIDLNYFNGDAEAFARRFGVPVPPEPPPPPGPGGRPRYRVEAGVLNVREGPGTNFKSIGTLQRGEIVEALEATADGSWIRVLRADGLTGWSSSRYLVRVDSPPPPPPPMPGTVKYRVNVATLNVREGPGTSFNVVGSLKSGEIVDALSTTPDGGWIQIRRNDGLIGWCSSQYLVKLDTTPPPDQAGTWHRVTATRLNVREGPGANSKTVGYLQKEDVVVSVGISADGNWVQIRRFDGLTGWCSSSYLVDLGSAIPTTVVQKLFSGVTYYRKERTAPRKMVSHALVIDLQANNRLRFLVTPPDRLSGPPLCSLKTSQFMLQNGAQIAVNGDGFSYFDPSTYDPKVYCPDGGDPVKPNGYAASRGKPYSEKSPGQPILYINQNNEFSFDRLKGNLYNAISGDRMLVVKGQPVAGLDGTRVDPRTAIGINRNSRWLALVVVDGRESSEGATFVDLADLLISFGAYTGMSLDGGGSSTMVIEGIDKQPRILNTPVDENTPGRERAVANHLGIYVKK